MRNKALSAIRPRLSTAANPYTVDRLRRACCCANGSTRRCPRMDDRAGAAAEDGITAGIVDPVMRSTRLRGDSADVA
nr:hypothetical protein GCM10020063_010720 [Dactylosporangium thailandense]